MTLSALLVCVDETAAQVLRQVLEELSIRVESCPDFVRAAVRLAQDRFDVVIVDGESNEATIDLLRETRQSRMNDATLAVAVVPGQDSIRELFSLGVNFVLYKPVDYERALSSLRAARAVMRKEKRKSARASVHAHATIDYADVQHEKATLVDLAQDGMAIRFGKKLPPTNKVYFQFRLPDQTATVRLSGQVLWQDWNGRAGVQFVDVPKASRKLLTDFLSINLPSEIPLELPDVTVEMEDPIQLTTTSVAEETHGSGATTKVSNEMKVHEIVIRESGAQGSSAGAAPAPDNRRTQTRYACRLGAEVYRVKTTVPTHCCLTDLSSGGCYLEVSLPFPQGSVVEIVVRTYEMKLKLQGTVQAAHPGYGMGVVFELKTQAERDSVTRLLDFVGASTDPYVE
jgi:CheY-like chemotaxis protein